MIKYLLAILLILSASPSFSSMTIGGLGSELYTVADAASDPNGNEADGDTGWSNSEKLTSSFAAPYAGTYSLAYAGDGLGDPVKTITVVIGKSYLVSLYARKQTGGSAGSVIQVGCGAGTIANSDVDTTSYVNFANTIGPCITTSLNIDINDIEGCLLYLDNISVKEVIGGSLQLDISGGSITLE